jgi:hypothetical protein
MRRHQGEDDVMTIANGRSQALATPERPRVITNSILLARRIRELQRRRQALVSQQEQVRAQLPDWAVEPLRLVGLTTEEIRGLVDDLSTAETEAGLDHIEKRLDDIDHQMEEIEDMLVTTPSSSLDEIEAVIGLAVARFKDIIVTDPGDVFYDHGEARLLALLERVQEDMSDLMRRSRLDVG